MSESDRVQTPIGEMWMDDGVLVHEITTFDVITADHAEAVVAAVKRLTGGRPTPAVVDIRAVGYALPEARHAFAGGVEESGEIATALVVANPASRALARVFLSLSRPQRPVRAFTNVTRALEWAREHVPPTT